MKQLGMVLILSSLIDITGCQNEDDSKILEKSKEVAIEYIDDNENRKLVVEDAEFISAIGRGTVFVYGFYEDSPSDKVSVAVDYSNSYKVSSVSFGNPVEVDTERGE